MEQNQLNQTDNISELMNFDASTIPVVAGGSGFNADLFAGKKVKIAKYEIRKETNFYPNGVDYDKASTEKCLRVYIFSEPLKELKLKEGGNKDNSDDYVFSDKDMEVVKEDGTTKKILVNARFNLQMDEEGKPQISKSPKAKLWAAMRKLGINTLPEIVGKFVMLDVQPSKEEGDDRKYLKFAL
jgi:hypothetical protein